MADHQHSLDLDKALAFAILMESDEGIVGKRPDYIMEKRRGLDECRDRMEVREFLDPFKKGMFDACRLKWFGERPTNLYRQTVTIPPKDARSSTTNEGEKQEPTLTLRFVRCDEHNPNYSAFCYVQDDSNHVQGNICTCGPSVKEDCPIDLHRRQAVKGNIGEIGLHA